MRMSYAQEFHRRNLQLGRSSHCLCRHGFLVGLRVSSRSPPIDGTTRPIPRFDRSVSMDSSSPGSAAGDLVCRRAGRIPPPGLDRGAP